MVCNPYMGGGSVDIVHHPSSLVLSKYREASLQPPWIADRQSHCIYYRYGDKQKDQNVK